MNHSEECSNTHCDKKLGRVESGSERFQFGGRAAIQPALNVTDKSHHAAWPLTSGALYIDEGCELPAVTFRIHFFDVGVLMLWPGATTMSLPLDTVTLHDAGARGRTAELFSGKLKSM